MKHSSKKHGQFESKHDKLTTFMTKKIYKNKIKKMSEKNKA